MPKMFDRAIVRPVHRILAKNKYHKVEHAEEDVKILRDTEPQILDAGEDAEVSAAEPQLNGYATDEHAAAADVPATATLLGDTGADSHDQPAPAGVKGSRKSKNKSSGLLGCLHFSAKADGATGGLPTAFNNRQTILKRLANKAKKTAPPAAPARPARPPKKSPYVLHAAAWRTNINELQTQLAAGSEVSKRDKAGLTPLHYAAWQGSVDAVQILLDAGADVNVRDPEGMLPVHFAAWFNRLDTAALLLDRGSQINPPTKASTWPTTPLIYASKMGHADMVSLLMDRGALVAAAYKAASSALHEAAWGGHTDVVAEMMRRDVSHDVATGKAKYRPLHLAAMNGNASVVQELLIKGAWVDARSQLGRTPLHLACEKGHISTAGALVAGGADLLAKDRHGFTPLHLAVDNNHVQLAKLLLDKGATPDAADARGALPLNFAHDPDFYKLLRAVRWYGAASVPSGNNPTSSRYISTGPPAPAAEIPATAAATTEIAAATEAAPVDVLNGTDAVAAAEPAGVAAPAVKARASKADKNKSPRQSAKSWIKAHIPQIRSHKSAVAAAAAQPGSSTLETPEQASAADDAHVPPFAAKVAAISEALAGRVGPGGRISPFPGGRASPAGSQRSTESAAAHVAAVNLAHAAVKAVVARAAAEAALEEVAHDHQVRQASVRKSESPVGSGGAFTSPERDSADDARLLEQIRSALAAGTTGALPEPAAAAAATAAGAVAGAHDAAIPEEYENVTLEDYMRPPASISISAPRDKATPEENTGNLPSPDDVQDRSDQAPRQFTADASERPLPVSTNAVTDAFGDTSPAFGADALTAAPKSPSDTQPGMVHATAKPHGSAGKAGGMRYAAPTASAAAKKASKSTKRKSKAHGHGAVAGAAKTTTRVV